MKRIVPFAVLALGACQQPERTSEAKLWGTYSLVQVDDLVFVTSTDKNELKVLDLAASPRGFVRGPNPLEALSIPVLDRPIGLARDEWFDDATTLEGGAVVPDGRKMGGPYVYALSAGASEISIVGARKNQLVEAMRLPTPGPVTAAAGRGPEGGSGKSTLYFAASGVVYAIELPPYEELVELEPKDVTPLLRVIGTLPGEAVSALLPLPNDRLVVATRKDAGRSGRTLLVDLRSLVSTELPFPGPLRQLDTHATVEGMAAAGDRVFGVLDPSVCTPAGCGGIIAVDLSKNPPAIASDVTGHPMSPIYTGVAIPQDLALGERVDTRVRTSEGTYRTETLVLGIVSASNGELFLFDAGALRHIDDVPAQGGVVKHDDGSVVRRRNSSGQESAHTDESFGIKPSKLAAADGAARDEAIHVVHQGMLPALQALPTSQADGDVFHAPADALGPVRVGDTVVIEAVDPADPEKRVMCETKVASVEPAGLRVASVAPECQQRTAFTVRVPQGEYVVAGELSGYMGRVRANERLAFSGSYYHHPDGFDPQAPQFALEMGAHDPSLERDGRYVVTTAANFAPLAMTVADFAGMTLPGSVAIDPIRQQAFVAYPSANAIVELTPSTVSRGPNGAGKIVPYR